MDTTQQQSDQLQTVDDTQAPAIQQVQTTQTVQDKNQPVAQPVSSASVKEAEPVAVQEVSKAVEYIKPSEPEPMLSQEVKDAGVQAVSHAPYVHENIAVKPSAEVTPVVASSNPLDQVMTKEEILSAQKLPPTTSARWLSVLISKIWLQITTKKQ